MAGRRIVPAAGRLASVMLGLALAVPIVLVGAAGHGYGRIGRASVAVSIGSRILLRALGIRVSSGGRGHPRPRAGAGLVVANRGSWVDLVVIAATTPVVPVATCEIADRPVIGGLARRMGTVFVPRRPCRQLPGSVADITAILRRGHRVLVFPEATTTRGGSPGTFHRAGFQAAVDAAVPVLPVAIRYTDGRGRPSPSAAFVADDALLTSVWRLLRSGPLVATVSWQPAAAAIEDGGHRAGHRRRAAGGAHRRICGALAPAA